MIKHELKEPIEEEIETYTKEMYDELLDEEGPIIVAGMKFDASYILKELDPIAYRCGFNDIQEYKTIYKCPICDKQHDDEDDAKSCCQDLDIYECEHCGQRYDDEEECEEHENNCENKPIEDEK